MGVLNRICNEKHRAMVQTNGDIPNEIVSLVDKLLEKDLAKRFDSMHAVESEIERLLAALQSGGLSLTREIHHVGTGQWFRKHFVHPYAMAFTATVIFLSIPALLRMFQPSSYDSAKQFAEPSRNRTLAKQLRAERNEDMQFFSELDQVQRELFSLQIVRPLPNETGNAEFVREVQALQSAVHEIEMLSPH